MTDKDGGPAYPLDGGCVANGNTGMSLRDWFAGQAMQAMITNDAMAKRQTDHASKCGEKPQTATAMAAYILADAMLAERNRKSDDTEAER